MLYYKALVSLLRIESIPRFSFKEISITQIDVKMFFNLLMYYHIKVKWSLTTKQEILKERHFLLNFLKS